MCSCIYVYVYAYLCYVSGVFNVVYVCICVYKWCVCGHVYAYMCMHMNVYVCVLWSMYACDVHVCMWDMCACVHACGMCMGMCVYVYVCV